MAQVSGISWCDSSFSPWLGCTKVSDGCTGCYAEALMDKRMGRVQWGAGQPRRRTSESYWRQPLAWDRKARASGKPWRVFCGSLCDVFDNEVPDEWRRDLFDLIARTPNLTWMLLTKRVGNVEDMLPGGWYARSTYPNGPWPNVWIGATVVNQEEYDRDIGKLLRTPAAKRFLSIEPMLSPIDMRMSGAAMPDYAPHRPLPRLDWVIVGGESNQPGHRARPFNIEWARDVVRQCRAAGVPPFVKQCGSYPITPCTDCDDCVGRGRCYSPLFNIPVRLHDRAGADPSEWREDLRVREFPR